MLQLHLPLDECGGTVSSWQYQPLLGCLKLSAQARPPVLPPRRIKAIREMLPTAEGLYEMSGCDVARGPLAQFRRAVMGVDWQ
jgi:hypothetical protein